MLSARNTRAPYFEKHRLPVESRPPRRAKRHLLGVHMEQDRGRGGRGALERGGQRSYPALEVPRSSRARAAACR